MNPFLLVLLAYLVGSTPTSWMMSRWVHGVDLTRKGSGNLGATNVFRVLGWKAAVPVVVVDVGKGFLPVWLFPGLDSPEAWAWALAYGGAAIVGHVFSFWLRFRGGKGVATSAGVLLALAPVAVLSALLVWLLAVFSTRIVSVGSLAAAVTAAAVVWIRPPLPVGTVGGGGAGIPGGTGGTVGVGAGEGLGGAGGVGGLALQTFVTLLALFVVWAHRANIGRLLSGTENRFGSGGPPRESGGSPPGGPGPAGRDSGEPGRTAEGA